MDSPAFTVNGMFSPVTVGKSTFRTGMTSTTPNRGMLPTTPRMAVDPYLRKFQSFGKIGIDYSRPKKLASYLRSGYSATLDYPNQASFAGKYAISACGKPSGTSKILMKYDEYCAKGMMQVFKRSAIPFGVYNSKCDEGTVKLAANEKRIFSRTMAFREAQKPVNVRLRQQYETRRACFIMANNCSREEDQFKNMPISAATFMVGKMEAMGTCSRSVLPGNVAEDYMAAGIKKQLTVQVLPWGTFGVGSCHEGSSKGEAEERRIAARAAEFRAMQQSPATVTGQQYESARTAVKLYAQNCSHEQAQLFQYPAAAAAFCRY